MCGVLRCVYVNLTMLNYAIYLYIYIRGYTQMDIHWRVGGVACILCSIGTPCSIHTPPLVLAVRQPRVMCLLETTSKCIIAAEAVTRLAAHIIRLRGARGCVLTLKHLLSPPLHIYSPLLYLAIIPQCANSGGVTDARCLAACSPPLIPTTIY